jgi:cobaltochelatase CobT
MTAPSEMAEETDMPRGEPRWNRRRRSNFGRGPNYIVYSTDHDEEIGAEDLAEPAELNACAI